jgi:hypothetical protein
MPKPVVRQGEEVLVGQCVVRVQHVVPTFHFRIVASSSGGLQCEIQANRTRRVRDDMQEAGVAETAISCLCGIAVR